MPFQDRRQTLLLVDDEPANLHVLKHILQDDYRLLFARDGERALQLAATEQPQLILLDVMMPGTTGHEVCARLKADPLTDSIPVIFVTALSNVEDEALGFELGAVDYISKPVSAPIVRARVRTHLSLVRAETLRQTRLHIVQALGMASEYKDNETGLHIIRMSHFSRVIALEAGFSAEEADELLHAAPMHDVGKIGIPDAILQKPGKLDAEEWAVMQQHPEIGARIIGEHEASMLQMARRIALSHHEKWDGSGYPSGLKGTDIPVEGRIVAIADVFDALTSQRPYKPAWSIDDAVNLIREQSGKHFDPDLVTCFLNRLDEIVAIRERWAE
ncbi:HD-GYP domain-containing protein [Halopseudomonas pachastrellae]|uniref:HD-GYP domain-containing protein n=1 Tax=Halopseudomonas pachastrellae TaxID=254161 RepID=UPI003D7CEFAE|tara:strand:+ start:1764 stop:2753 length:990 start_codon:yes stop_codon:yes gene_type:complete